MAIVIVTKNQNLSKEDFEKAKEEYTSYVKITIDLENESVALGGKWHADAEKILLENDSKQKNLWGGGIDLETNEFETNAMINIRPGQNDSTEILDKKTKQRFLEIAKRVLKNYVK